MIGNDIVDLGDSESRTEERHPRFDERVFDPSELHALSQAPSVEQMRWILWAAKESAYKAARRHQRETIFSPRRFVVNLDHELRGSVRVGDRYYEVQVDLDGSCIHAVVAGSVLCEDTIWGTRRLSDERGDPSQQVREFAIESVARRLEVSDGDVRVTHSGRIPELRIRGRSQPAALSLSHHGAYLGFACRLSADAVKSP